MTTTAGARPAVEVADIIGEYGEAFRAKHGGCLTDDREPAQPHKCVEAHIAARVVRAEAEYRHSAV